jgi:hypothetical protein
MRNNHHPPDPTPSRATSHSRTPSEPRLAGSVHPRARRLHRRLWLLTLVGAVGVVLAVAAPAFAGTWVQVSCVNPDNSAAPSEGWTSYGGGGAGDGSTSSSQCAPGSPMFAFLSTAVAAPVGAGETVQYTPPAGSTLIGGTAQVSMTADGFGAAASGTAVAYSPNPAYDAGDVFFQCAYGIQACGPGGSVDFTGQLTLPTDRGGGFYLSAACGGIGGQYCNVGGSGGTWASVQLRSAQFELANTATPAATGITGPLLSANARAIQEVTFTATDPGGPGVYNVTAQIDGSTVYSATPDGNSGNCVSVGTLSGALMFDHQQPCKQSENVDLPVETTALIDGQHTLKLTVTDAAGNASVIYDSAITTLNAPTNTGAPASVGHNGDLFVGDALAASDGGWSAPSGAGAIDYSYQWQDCDAQGNNCAAIAGATAATYTAAPSDTGHTLRVAVTAANNDGFNTAAAAPTNLVQSASGSLGAGPGPGTPTPSTPAAPTPSGGVTTPPSGGSSATPSPGTPNGSVASVSAVLRLGLSRVIARSFFKRAFTLNGRLLGPTGAPITGASLDVLEQILVASGPMTVIAHAKSGKGGAFSVKVPAGPSRIVEVGYRAYSKSTTYATITRVQENVSAGVTLAVTPTSTTATGKLVLTGRVEGAVPPQGVVVELLVHYLGHWEPFRSIRTTKTGRFRVVYQFQGGRGTFPFRARVRGHQQNFSFTLGQSKVHDVNAH